MLESPAGQLSQGAIHVEAFAVIETQCAVNESILTLLYSDLKDLSGVTAQNYLDEMIHCEPPAALHELGKSDDAPPVLIVHGRCDLEVAGADARTLTNAWPDAEMVVIVDKNHLLKRIANDNRDPNVAVRSNPRIPIVLNDAERWF